MKIKLTNEQINAIANIVAGGPGTSEAKRPSRRRAIVAIKIPEIPGPVPELSTPGENLLLTVRADLVAVVQAIRNGSQKHALELSENLLGHVEEVLAER